MKASCRAVLALLGIVASSAVTQQAVAGDLHLGVASCASSFCHGSADPLQVRPILQNEYVTWSHFDPHSRGYRVLLEPRSVTIARRLNIGPANEAPACLACHAEQTTAAQRGPRWQLTDGVGCESCHGPAERWLASHDDSPTVTHADTIAAGMLPIERAAVRAPLCSACHVGSKDRLATHAMMAAGHPRLSFELDTWTEIWRTSGGREHFRRDADYLTRKPVEAPVTSWVAGLLVQAQERTTLLDSAWLTRGLMPEFALFNCYSCHRNMKLKAWRERPDSAGAPGALRIDDASYLMLDAVLQVVQPRQAATLRAQIAQVAAATSGGAEALRQAARSLTTALNQIEPTLLAHQFTATEKRAILARLLGDAEAGRYPDYVAAEQAAMASALLLADIGADKEMRGRVDELFELLREDEHYDAPRVALAMARLRPPAAANP